MFRGGLDGLDGFLHGADTLVVEFATGKLPVLDFGVEAGNQFPQRWDLRLGGGTVAGDHFHDFARAALAAMPALGFRQTDRGRDPFFEMISGQCRQTRHANRIVEHGVRRLGLSTAARITGARAMTSASLSWFWKKSSSVARAMPSGFIETERTAS